MLAELMKVMMLPPLCIIASSFIGSLGRQLSHFADEAAVSQTCGDLSDGKPANWSVGGFLLKQKYIPIIYMSWCFLIRKSHSTYIFKVQLEKSKIK